MDGFPSKAVFDCNIFVQALLNPFGASGRCFDAAHEERIVLFISDDLLEEVRDVLLRPNILARLPGSTPEQIEAFVEEIVSIADSIADIGHSFDFERDPNDEKILDLAIACKAEYIVSRDNDLLDLMTDFDESGKSFRQRFRKIKIIEPHTFLKIIFERDLSLKP